MRPVVGHRHPGRPQRAGERRAGSRRRPRSTALMPQHLVERVPDPVGVLAVLHQRAQRRRRGREVDLGGAEVVQRARPVERLGDARAASAGRRGRAAAAPPHHLAAQRLGDLRGPRAHDLDLALEARVVDPVVEAAALERVVQLARAVGGQHHDRRRRGAHGAELGDRDLVGRQHLEQERLELVVGPVDLVDQQHGGALLQRLRAPGARAGSARRTGSSRPPRRSGRRPPRRLERAQVQDLPREVPVVERLGGVDALVALQPHQRQVRGTRRSPRPARSCRCRARPRAAAGAASSAPGR